MTFDFESIYGVFYGFLSSFPKLLIFLLQAFGALLAARGIFFLRTASSPGSGGITTATLQIIFGSLLVVLFPVVDLMTQTLFSKSPYGILSYMAKEEASNYKKIFQQIVQLVFMFVQILGYFFFGRALVLLAQNPEYRNQQTPTIGQALVMLFFSLLMINAFYFLGLFGFNAGSLFQ
jgi:hypothetical protein